MVLKKSGIGENVRFLVLEVSRQLDDAQRVLSKPDEALVHSIEARDDYIDNLKTVIESKCFELTREAARDDKRLIEWLKAVDVCAANLERIGDHCVSVAGQSTYFADPTFIERFDPTAHFAEIASAMELVVPALFERNVSTALQICRTEFNLDGLYLTVFNRIKADLRAGGDTDNLLTTLFIFRYLERIGDALLNVGEAIISASVGERLKIHQYRALEEALDGAAALGLKRENLMIEAVGETRSGCRIGRVEERGPGGTRPAVIFKEGRRDKIAAEVASIEVWRKQFPDLVPKVHAFQENGENASVLLEFLPGRTLQEWLLHGEDHQALAAVDAVADTLETLWNVTRWDEPVPCSFLADLPSRIGDVYRAHREFQRDGVLIGKLALPDFSVLTTQARKIEDGLAAPFSVRVHGDLNNDNILYDSVAGKIRFIDVHRSQQSDYVRDVAVLAVSNFRMPVFQRSIRERIERINRRLIDRAERFAREAGDTTFSARLAFGLARSFATSTRFILDESFSEDLYLRARFLLQKLLTHSAHGSTEPFELPRDVLDG